MSLDSLEYKELVVAFGRDVNRVADDLYEATSEPLPPERRAEIIAAGRQKVRDFAEMLGRVDGARKAEVQKRFGGLVREIEEFLKTLTEKQNV